MVYFTYLRLLHFPCTDAAEYSTAIVLHCLLRTKKLNLSVYRVIEVLLNKHNKSQKTFNIDNLQVHDSVNKFLNSFVF